MIERREIRYYDSKPNTIVADGIFMNQDKLESLEGKLLALDLLLRGLYTQWAMNASNPADTIRDGICGLMDSVRENVPPESESQHRVYDYMDAELTTFMLSVEERLALLASTK